MHKKIKAYTGSGPVLLIVGCIFFAFSFFAFLPDATNPAVTFGVMFAISAIFILAYVIGCVKLNKMIDRYAQTYGAKTIAHDFRESQPVLDGHLRAGHEWLFGKRTGVIARYDEITKIYLYVHKTNGIEDKRALMIEMGRKSRELCKIPTKGVFKKQNHPDVEKILRYVLHKNPNVHVGYK